MDNLLIGDFEGPLDLLLHLIKKSKMEIFDIEISEITKEYLNYIKEMTDMNLDIASEYLVMASELMEIKSSMLLPNEKIDDDEYEDDYDYDYEDDEDYGYTSIKTIDDMFDFFNKIHVNENVVIHVYREDKYA